MAVPVNPKAYLASVLVLHAPGVLAPPPLQGTRTVSRVGLRLVYSWCFRPDLVWEWNSSDSLCCWHPLHSVSSTPVLQFSAPVGIRVQPVLQHISVPRAQGKGVCRRTLAWARDSGVQQSRVEGRVEKKKTMRGCDKLHLWDGER